MQSGMPHGTMLGQTMYKNTVFWRMNQAFPTTLCAIGKYYRRLDKLLYGGIETYGDEV